MRILFDQNVPHKLRTRLLGLASHEIFTAAHRGWSALKNGDLLRAAEGDGFDVLITADLGIIHQQNPSGRRLAIVALSTNNWRIIENEVTEILRAIDEAKLGSFRLVECGRFGRKWDD